MRTFKSRNVVIWSAVFVATLAAATTGAHAEDPAQPTMNMPGAQGGGNTLMNPAISLDGLFDFSQFNRDNPLTFSGGHDPKQNGFNIQQVELTFGSNVDPYFRADANLVLTSDGIEIEEAYATTLELPWNLQARAGQFLTLFGRQNPTHPHAWDFVDMPLVSGRMFGGDGLRNPGAQLSWLTPLPIYSEVILSAQNSNGDTAPSFLNNSGTKMRSIKDAVFMGRLNNFVPVSDWISVNFGASYLQGPNTSAYPDTHTHILGGDLFVKLRNPSSLSFWTLTSEVMRRSYQLAPTGATSTNDWGWYAQVMYRLGEPLERWFVGARYDWVGANTSPVHNASATGVPDADSSKRFRISPVVTFYPSEFSKLRMQYEYDKPQSFDHAQQVVSMQIEFLMGSHGAHKF